MTNRLDHFMYAAPDLDASIARFAEMSGVTAGRGGSHPGMGTRNALASLGSDVYLELIAPDPAQKLDGTYGGRFAALAAPQVFAYIVKSDNLEALKAAFAKHGIESDLIEASRKTPEGGTLQWRLLIPRTNPFGEYAPKFIDWKDTPHPARTSIGGCTFEAFEIGHPDADRFGALLRTLDCALTVERSDKPFLRARIKTPKGPLLLTSG
jgi:hypothetical protein